MRTEMINEPSDNILKVLLSATLKPPLRPQLPSFDSLQPAMKRTAWLNRAREEHHLFGLAQKILELCDPELAEIACEHIDGLTEMDQKLQAIYAHYENGIEVIQSTRSRIANALAEVSP